MQHQLPAIILDIIASESDEVAAMVERINQAVYDRATFERSKQPNGSHIELRRTANAWADSSICAAFLIYLNANPDTIFNRSRKDGTRANLKGLQKVKTLFDYVMGRKDVIDFCSFALFASTIIAAKMGTTWVSSQEQELILSSEKVNSLPRDVQNSIRQYQHKYMSIEGDSRNQSCLFRTTYANLGLYHVSREDWDNTNYSLGVMVDTDNPLIMYLSDRWELNRYA